MQLTSAHKNGKKSNNSILKAKCKQTFFIVSILQTFFTTASVVNLTNSTAIKITDTLFVDLLSDHPLESTPFSDDFTVYPDNDYPIQLLLSLDNDFSLVWHDLRLNDTKERNRQWLLISGICDDSGKIKKKFSQRGWSVWLSTETCEPDLPPPEFKISIVFTSNYGLSQKVFSGGKNLELVGEFEPSPYYFQPSVGVLNTVGTPELSGFQLTASPYFKTQYESLFTKVPDFYHENLVMVNIVNIPVTDRNMKWIPEGALMNQMVEEATSIEDLHKTITTQIFGFSDAVTDRKSLDFFESQVMSDGKVNVQLVINHIKMLIRKQQSGITKDELKISLDKVIKAIQQPKVELEAEASAVDLTEEAERKEQMLAINPWSSRHELVRQLVWLYNGSISKIVSSIFYLRPDLQKKLGWGRIKRAIRNPPNIEKADPVDAINIEAILTLLQEIENLDSILRSEISSQIRLRELKAEQSSQSRQRAKKRASQKRGSQKRDSQKRAFKKK